MAKSSDTIKVPLTITLSEKAYRQILSQVEGEGEDAQKLAAFTQEAISEISKGAMLLPKDTVEALVNLDDEMNDPDAILAAVERGLGVHEGAMVAKWNIDPALHEPLRQRAEVQGTTVDALIQEMMDQAVALGWFWDLEARVRNLFFNPEQYAKLCEALGETEVTGELLLSRILTAPEEKPEEEASLDELLGQAGDPESPSPDNATASDQDQLQFAKP